MSAERGTGTAGGGGTRIELLSFDGCPSHEALLPRLEALLARAGVEASIESRRVESEEAAVAERFLGSPTVRIDGVDVEPRAGRRDDFGLKCRLYRTAGGVSGQPPLEWVEQALGESSRAEAG